MPKKRQLTPDARASLEKYLNESHSAALIVRSVFAGYFTQDENIMKDVEELVREHSRIKEHLRAAKGY